MGTLNLAGTLANGTLATKPASTGGSSAITFVILAVLVILFYMLVMRPQRNRQRRTMETQNQVVPGQRIRTTAGMYGTIVSGDDRDVTVEIAPGVEVTMLRRAIMEVIPDDYGMPEQEDLSDESHEDESEDSAADDDWDVTKDHDSEDWDVKDRNV